MQRIIFIFFLAAGLVGSLSASTINDWQLSPEGFGPIQIGMTLKQAEQVAGMKFGSTKPEVDQAEDESCFYVSLKGTQGLSFMISGDKIVRINITSSSFSTSKGARIGDSEAQVQALYAGKLEVEPHHYDQNGHYLTLIETLKDRAIRFETDAKVITQIYSGRNQETHYVEGCL
ncbi:hypothetical protein [Legionella feeleii]|uniref:Uncharacterized protein n=1 Tax=Legionella feeleii TaxID=453 RepID=A0A0W0U698_9GAMM|nr:hypothetical protein [Legionella feeleii]KTD03095.1 hypothetical protein Lfee_0451 [Legionella feeleii]SPX61323.1 Uncharacterised protein [Legionella feeleii]STX38904.1 Uncharacterised protein [Legionella feeleii]